MTPYALATFVKFVHSFQLVSWIISGPENSTNGRISNALFIPRKFSALMFSSLSAWLTASATTFVFQDDFEFHNRITTILANALSQVNTLLIKDMRKDFYDQLTNRLKLSGCYAIPFSLCYTNTAPSP
ncbi:hypothetical protein Tco_1561897 [Tanacetum coccineum]